MKSKIHNLTLQGKTGIYFGLISALYIYFNQFLINQFSVASGITSILPISFFEIILKVLLVIFVLLSYFLIVFTNKIRLKKNRDKKWKSQAKKIRRIYLIHLIFTSIIFYFLLNSGLIKFIIPISLIVYGIASIIANKHTNGNSLLLGIFFLVTGIISIAIPNFQFHLCAISFGGFHIIYGILYS